MIDGVGFIKENYERINNSNDPDVYKTMFHPDVLWCPPGLEDKRGADLVAFSFGLKNYNIDVKVNEIEGINGDDFSYVTGLVAVRTYTKSDKEIDSFVLRGSWVVVENDGSLCIRYQVWNKK